MKNNLSPIDEAVHNYSGGMDQRFNLKAAVRAVGARLAETPSGLENAVESALARDPGVFFDFQKQNYVPRHLFFKYKKFLILPTEEEVKDGVLIPGHRLIPFLSRLVHPGDCQFKGVDGQLPWKNVSRCLRDLDIYFSLFNTSSIYQYLFRESRTNGRILEESDGLKKPLSIGVLDMADWFAAVDFQVGDSIQVTIDDWKQGHFSFAHHSMKHKNLVSEWCNQLEEVVHEVVFDLLGPVTDLYEQLSLAFFLGADALIHNPQIHVGGFLEYMDEIMLTRLAGEPIFWIRGEAPEEALLEFSGKAAPLDQATDNINGLLSHFGLTFGEDELEAYIRDELYHRQNSLKAVLKRYLICRPRVTFVNKEQEEHFLTLCQDKWDSVSAGYNRFLDQIPGRSRAAGLKALDQVLAWMCDLDMAEMDLSKQSQKHFVELAGMTTILTEIIVSLNDPDLGREKTEVVIAGITQLEIRLKVSMEALRPRASARARPILRVIQGGKGHKKVFQLRIELEGEGSPVWRRIQVRCDSSLAELHQVLQAIMGWTDDHHHIFKINDQLYGNRKNTENTDCRNELETLLSQALPTRGETFLYEYDFRNSWRHLVLVEEITKLAGNVAYPLCLGGRGRHPPEGVDAAKYRYMLKVLADPHHPDYSRLNDATKGEFEPGYLQTDEINQRLKELSSE